MPISSSAGGDDTTCVSDVSSHARSLVDRTDSERPGLGAAAEGSQSRAPKNCVRQAQCALYYPWLIERISQTFFQEWIGAHRVPTKIDHAEWLCTMCGEYTATWETRSGSYCKYCWSLGQTSPLGPVPAYLMELIPYDEV